MVPPKSSSARKHATATTRHQSEYVLHKNPSYAAKVESRRKRWKSLKQIVDGMISTGKTGATMGVEGEAGTKQQASKRKRQSDRASLLSSQSQDLGSDIPTEQENYVTIAAAPSTHPPLQHYCDVTGLPTPYRDPKTGLYYRDAGVFASIRACSMQRVQQFLGLRNAGVNI